MDSAESLLAEWADETKKGAKERSEYLDFLNDKAVRTMIHANRASSFIRQLERDLRLSFDETKAKCKKLEECQKTKVGEECVPAPAVADKAGLEGPPQDKDAKTKSGDKKKAPEVKKPR